MRIIYEPRGKAREYAPLAANLYSGCSHGCKYCYVPGCLRCSREDFAAVSVRRNVLGLLERDARQLNGDTREILLCFTCDPYQEAERTERVSRRALEMLLENRLRVRLLTKNPALALELDPDLMKAGEVEFGTTLIFADDGKRAEWEPFAPTVQSRIAALRTARDMGLKTWVSLEPVIDPDEALALIGLMHDFVDVWKVGRWNHDARANAIDWPVFTKKCLTLFQDVGARYYIKDGLWKSAGADVRTAFRKDRL
ncbi:MAG: radical SAM protein [Planctomycetota bacterium]|jgi:DNA repair photolyase